MNFPTFLQEHLLFEGISGSRAYGTNLPGSDTDIRGVFILPQADFYGLNYTEQLSDETNDVVYFELKRFIDLLSKNNPNLLEMLAMPAECKQFVHPLFEQLTPELFLSKLCKNTFAGYAQTQIKKARGLNKKILNPVDEKRKSILDFCYVIQDYGSVPVKQWLEAKNYQQEDCGLINIPHAKNLYGVFYEQNGNFKGITQKDTANEVSLSSIPAGHELEAYLSFNKDGYSAYCKSYKEYWAWVGKRNNMRYQNTLNHGKNYDAKNMMHTFRLLDMALEIGEKQQIIVRRPNRAELLKIRAGEFEYDDLLDKASQKLEAIELAYQESDLPEKPDLAKINGILIEIRERFYRNPYL